MKKAFKIIYIVLFLLICFVPLAFMPFVKNDASLEKRELTPLPAYMIDGRLNVDFSTQFESWFNDRIPFRPQLLTAANAIKGELLHASTSNVIVGKDGWLYYDSESKDYMNTNAMSDAEINAAAVSISLMQENVESKNGHFLFVPMPNKASVYDEYMPACYTKASENNLSRLMARMDEVGVNYIDMKKLMTDNKDKGLYHRRDSHWNYQGALLGYNAMMDALGKEHKTYADLTPSVVKDWRGDLDKLLYDALWCHLCPHLQVKGIFHKHPPTGEAVMESRHRGKDDAPVTSGDMAKGLHPLPVYRIAPNIRLIKEHILCGKKTGILIKKHILRQKLRSFILSRSHIDRIRKLTGKSI